MDQLRVKTLEEQQRPDRPADQKAEPGIGLAAHPRADQGRGNERRPGKEDQGRNDQVIAGKTPVCFHVGRDAMKDLPAHGEPKELASRRDADRDEPGKSQHRQSDQSVPPVQPFPARGAPTAATTPGADDEAIKAGPTGPLTRIDKAQAEPEQARPACAKAVSPAPTGRTGSRKARAPGSRPSSPAWIPRRRSVRSPGSSPPAARPGAEHPPSQQGDAQHGRARRRAKRPAGLQTDCHLPAAVVSLISQ